MTNIYKDYIYRHIYIKTILYIYIYIATGKAAYKGNPICYHQLLF